MNTLSEKERLEIEKLKEEIKSLKVSPWAKPTILFPILIPLLAVLISFYVNKDYVNLRLQINTLKLERESIALEDRKKILGTEIAELSKKLVAAEKIASDRLEYIKKLENRRDVLSSEIANIDKKLKSSEKSATHRLTYIKKKAQLELLQDAIQRAISAVSGYRRYLETGDKNFFINYKRLYKDDLVAVFNKDYKPYDLNDDLKKVETEFLQKWGNALVSLNDFEKRVVNKEEMNKEKYITIFNAHKNMFTAIPSLESCHIGYDDLLLICRK